MFKLEFNMNKKQIIYISIFSVTLLIAIILFTIFNTTQLYYYLYIALILLMTSAIMLNLWVRSKNAEERLKKINRKPQSKLLMYILLQQNQKKKMKLINYTKQ